MLLLTGIEQMAADADKNISDKKQELLARVNKVYYCFYKLLAGYNKSLLIHLYIYVIIVVGYNISSNRYWFIYKHTYP